MALVVDSGALIALYDGKDPFHEAIVSAAANPSDVLIVPVLAVTEVAYLLTRIGLSAQLALLNDLANGVYQIEGAQSQDFRRCSQILEQYSDLNLDFVDAVVLAVAERLKINRILTVDQRDFRIIRSTTGKPFTLVPWDDQ